MQKQFDPKWLTTLKSNEDITKRYKAFLSIKKFYKDTGDPGKYKSILDDYCSPIFQILTDKMMKLTSGWDMMSLFGPSSPKDVSADIIEAIHDLFVNLDKKAIIELRSHYKMRLVVLLKTLIDPSTKREARNNGFNFLIRILHSYDDPSQADREYIALFNFSFVPQENSVSYNFTVNPDAQHGTNAHLYHEYTVFSTSLVDLAKTLSNTDSPGKYDELKEVFLTVVSYTYLPEYNAQLWYKFLMKTWLYLYFNDKKEEKELKHTIFIESWKTGFIQQNISLLQCLPKYIETVMLDNTIILTLEELFSLMSKIEYLYWNVNITNEITAILKIYSNFIGKKFKFNTDFDYEQQIFKKIIGTLNELFQRYLWKATMGNHSKNDIDTPEDRICIDICYELISLYKAQYGNEIFSSVTLALEKRFESLKELILSECLTHLNELLTNRCYSLIEVVIVVSTLATPQDREKYMKGIKPYIELPEITTKFIEFHRKKILDFVNLILQEVKVESLAGLEIVQGTNVYPMRVEYLPQLFLQVFCNECKEKKEIDYQYFEKDIKKLKLLTVREKKGTDMKEVLKNLETYKAKFEEWIKMLVIIYNYQLYKESQNFTRYCLGFKDLITDLVNPENANISLDKSKPPVQIAKYPMPTETLYVKQIFDHFFGLTLQYKEDKYLESNLYSMGAYLEILTNTQSEIPCSKEIIRASIKIISSIFQNDSIKYMDFFIVKKFFVINIKQKCFLIRYSKNLFAQDIAGTKILVPLYLRFIEEFVSTQRFSNLDKEYKVLLEKMLKIPFTHSLDYLKHYRLFLNASMRIIKSVVFFGYTISDMEILPIDKALSKIKTFKDIRVMIIHIVKILMDDIHKYRTSSNVFQDSAYFDNEVIYNYFTIAMLVMYSECDPKTPPLQEYELSAELYVDNFFELLSIDFKELPKNTITLFTHILENLSFLINPGMLHYKRIYKKSIRILLLAIKKLLSIGTHSTTKETASEFFYVLSRFILNDQAFVLYEDNGLLDELIDIIIAITKITDFREFAENFFTNILLYYANFPLKNLTSDSKSSIFEECSFKNFPSDYSKHLELNKVTKSNNSREDSEDEDILRPMLKSHSSRESRPEEFMTAKEMGTKNQRLRNLVAKFNYLNFPEAFSKKLILFKETELVDFINMLISKFSSETQDPNMVYLSYKDTTVISHVGSGSKPSTSRVIYRNQTGKFSWEFGYLKALNQTAVYPGKKSLESILHNRMKIKIKDFFEKERFEKKDGSNEIEDIERRIDLLALFSESMKITIPEVKSNSIDLDKPDEETKTRRIKKNQLFEDKYEKAKDFDAQRQSRKQRSSDSEMLRKKDMLELTNHTKYLDLTSHTIKMSSKDGTRLLMANLGFASLFKNNPEMTVFESDKNGKELSTTLNLLDNSLSRESIKIGVLYVKRGQDHQREILKNDEGSMRYNKFIQKLGDSITLKSHLGFQAGLDYQKDGDEAIYSGDVLTEVMYHVVTMMPTDSNDDQSVNKKKHVGNDSVNIVWCENYRAYRKNTVSSSFNSIQIIIYPMNYKMCRVQVLKKDNVGLFFPDLDNVLISEEYLPIFVKLSAMNGVRDVRIQKEPVKATQKRLEYIKQMIDQKCSNSIKRKLDIKDLVFSLLGDNISN